MRVISLLLFVAVALGYAFWRGGGPERAFAILWSALIIADPLLHYIVPLEYKIVDQGHLIIDIVGWLGASVIACFAYRFWPLVVVSLQFLPLLAHMSRAVAIDMHPAAYLIMQVAPYWLLAPVLIIGTWYHRRRLQQSQEDPDWMEGAPWPFRRLRRMD